MIEGPNLELTIIRSSVAVSNLLTKKIRTEKGVESIEIKPIGKKMSFGLDKELKKEYNCMYK